MSEILIGEVTHYYSKLGVAALDLQAPLRRGDHVHVHGQTTDFEEEVESMEIDHHRITSAEPGDDVAIKVCGKVRDGDKVFLELEMAH